MKRKGKLIKIGNSKGIRIPKEYIESLNLGEEILLEATNGSLIIKPALKPRLNWEELFKVKRKEELLISDNVKNDFDEEEWEWK